MSIAWARRPLKNSFPDGSLDSNNEPSLTTEACEESRFIHRGSLVEQSLRSKRLLEHSLDKVKVVRSSEHCG